MKNDVNVPLFRIRIRRIRMFLCLPDPHPDLLVKGTDTRIRIRTPKCHGSPTLFISVYFSLAFLFLLYSMFKERSEEVDLQEVLKEIDEQIKERPSLFISVIKFEVLPVWYLPYRISILCSYLNPLLIHV